jgi:hypothetical protein
VLLEGAFTPSVGDQFDLLIAATLSGTFTISLPAGYSWQVSYGPPVTLEVLP